MQTNPNFQHSQSGSANNIPPVVNEGLLVDIHTNSASATMQSGSQPQQTGGMEQGGNFTGPIYQDIPYQVPAEFWMPIPNNQFQPEIRNGVPISTDPFHQQIQDVLYLEQQGQRVVNQAHPFMPNTLHPAIQQQTWSTNTVPPIYPGQFGVPAQFTNLRPPPAMGQIEYNQTIPGKYPFIVPMFSEHLIELDPQVKEEWLELKELPLAGGTWAREKRNGAHLYSSTPYLEIIWPNEMDSEIFVFNPRTGEITSKAPQ